MLSILKFVLRELGFPIHRKPSKEELRLAGLDDEGHVGSTTTSESTLRYMANFRRLPVLVPELELLLVYGMLCCIDTLLACFFLPLKLLAFWRMDRRDLFTGVLVLAGFLAFCLPMEPKFFSSLYHLIRNTSALKLYVMFNIMDLAGKLQASLSLDCVESLYRATSHAGHPIFAFCLFCGGCFFMLVQAFTLLFQVVIINVAINSDHNALFVLLVSSNFVELKTVFRKYSAESLFQLVLQDIVERAELVVFACVILVLHFQTPGVGTVQPLEVFIVLACESFVDFLKHYFISRLNQIPLSTYNTYLRVLMMDVVCHKFSHSLLPVAYHTKETLKKREAKEKEEKAAAESNGACQTTYAIATSALDGETIKCLFDDNFTFLPNPARRSAFVPFAHMALILWVAAPLIQRTIQTDPVLVIIAVACLGMLKLVISLITSGLALRYLCRTLLVVERDNSVEGGEPQGVSAWEMSSPMLRKIKSSPLLTRNCNKKPQFDESVDNASKVLFGEAAPLTASFEMRAFAPNASIANNAKGKKRRGSPANVSDGQPKDKAAPSHTSASRPCPLQLLLVLDSATSALRDVSRFDARRTH